MPVIQDQTIWLPSHPIIHPIHPTASCCCCRCCCTPGQKCALASPSGIRWPAATTILPPFPPSRPPAATTSSPPVSPPHSRCCCPEIKQHLKPRRCQLHNQPPPPLPRKLYVTFAVLRLLLLHDHHKAHQRHSWAVPFPFWGPRTRGTASCLGKRLAQKA